MTNVPLAPKTAWLGQGAHNFGGFWNILRRTLMFRRIILAVVLTASCLAQEKQPSANVARMEQIIRFYVPSKFMGTVLVAQDGKILLDKGYGFANLEWDIPNTPTTKF